MPFKSGFMKSLTAGAKRTANAASGFSGGKAMFKKPDYGKDFVGPKQSGSSAASARDKSGTKTALRAVGGLLGFGKKKKQPVL